MNEDYHYRPLTDADAERIVMSWRRPSLLDWLERIGIAIGALVLFVIVIVPQLLMRNNWLNPMLNLLWH